jgi:hypothetical protein
MQGRQAVNKMDFTFSWPLYFYKTSIPKLLKRFGNGATEVYVNVALRKMVESHKKERSRILFVKVADD